MSALEAHAEEINEAYGRIVHDANVSGYHINPDIDFTRGLVSGLVLNQERYGYMACPCRLASGNADEDRDIICPCDYRDLDLSDYGACYCGLYVSQEVFDDPSLLRFLPDRRGKPRRPSPSAGAGAPAALELSYPVWRCRVCGYLCAREAPPETCPVCRVKKDRFELFL